MTVYTKSGTCCCGTGDASNVCPTGDECDSCPNPYYAELTYGGSDCECYDSDGDATYYQIDYFGDCESGWLFSDPPKESKELCCSADIEGVAGPTITINCEVREGVAYWVLKIEHTHGADTSWTNCGTITSGSTLYESLKPLSNYPNCPPTGDWTPMTDIAAGGSFCGSPTQMDITT